MAALNQRWFFTLFFSSLKLLEKSTLPLPPDSSIIKKLSDLVYQIFEGIAGICLLVLSLPLGAIGIGFQMLSREKNQQKFPELDSLSFPPDFKMGVADSFFQSCGVGLTLPGKIEQESSDWNLWVKERFSDGRPRIEGDPNLSDFFINYFENSQILIDKLIAIGASTYRFSLERSVLEPQEGIFDEAYIQKYRNFIKTLKASGIQPFVTLHHFVNPDWFLAKGGFEKEENIEGFVKYCEKMCDFFGDLIPHVVTINEPAVYCFQAYIKGNYPPGKMNLALAAKVMKHLLISHCRIYERCKKKNPSLQIGISHNWLIFRAYSIYHPLERMVSYYLSEITHYALLRFFQTGKLSLQVPFFVNEKHEEPNAPNCLDFIGVQYYVVPLLKMVGFMVESVCYPHEKMSAMKARFYPQGLQVALDQAATLKKPVWVTETGFDIDQTQYLKTAFSIMSSSIAKGIPLKGALLWTLRDNLEWERGSAVPIGLHHANFLEKPVVGELIRPLYQKQCKQEEVTTQG